VRLLYCFLLISCLFSAPALGFIVEEGCGAGTCADCHTLGKDEAKEIFKDIQGEVQSVDFAAVPGLWRVELKTPERTIPLYLDFSKSYLITGNVIRLADRKNLTEARLRQLNPIDPARIPLEDALTIGNPAAAKRIIVFTDPHCPYCSKLHQVIKQAVAQRPDLLFQIKLMPIKQSSLNISKTIICNNSLEQLEAAFAGQTLPEPGCNTPVIEQTLTLARELGIRSTPTIVLPDGEISPGYKNLERLLELIDQAAAGAPPAVTTTAKE
jgi:thiol:disulfide interchange protein DsbC